MKTFVFSLLSLLLLNSAAFADKQRRTDGPAGSEFGDFSSWDGHFSAGVRFGGSFLANGDKTSFLVGADTDYRPTDLFGFRLSFEQALQKPRLSLIHFSPLLWTEISNFRPYLFGGPGVTYINAVNNTGIKFSMNFGLGGDFMMTDRLGFGMLWSYYAIFDTTDAHTLAARFSYYF